MIDISIVNGKIVTPNGIVSAGIGVENGTIVSIAKEPNLPAADKTIDAKGKYVFPGIIDGHVHLANFGNPFLSDSRTESKAAAFGGVTTMGYQMITPSVMENFDKVKTTWNDNATVDMFCSLFLSSARNLDEIPKCPELGITQFGEVGGYKGEQARMQNILSADDGNIFRVLEMVSKMGYPARLWIHCENVEIITMLQERLQKEGRTDAAAWSDSRPFFCEAEAIMRYAYYAEVTKCPLYIPHITTAEGLRTATSVMKKGKIDLVTETCPQYLTHTKNDAIFKKDPPIANVNPPLRTKKDNEALWTGIKKGWIKTIGSDHACMKRKQKSDSIWKAAMGVGFTTYTLPVLLSEGVHKRGLPLEKLVEICCFNPAKAYGLYPKKGTIEVGSDADIVVVDIDKKVKARLEDTCSMYEFNIYEGWEFTGFPVLTMVRGSIVMEDGRVIGKEGTGKHIPVYLTK